MAADQQLLNDLNTAFVAACIENGVNNTEVGANNISLTDKKVDEDDIVLTHAKAADIKADFLQYYGEGGEFKVYTALRFQNGRFVNADGSAYANLTFAEELLLRVKQSVFMTNPDLGVNNLMNRVDFVSSMAAGVAGNGNAAEQMLQNYSGRMFADLGIILPTDDELAGMATDEERAAAIEAAMAPLQALVDAKIAVLDTQGGGGIEGWNGMPSDDKSKVAQNAILSTCKGDGG